MKCECWKIILASALLLIGGGCGKKGKAVTDLERKQAAFLFTEADFARTMRDYPRAESVLVKVVELVPDNGSHWISLGGVRKKMGNASGAKDAYQSALRAYEDQGKKDGTDSDPWLKQVYALALLGRVDDARALVEKIAKRFPGDRDVRIFTEDKQFDQMLVDPTFKEMAL